MSNEQQIDATSTAFELITFAGDAKEHFMNAIKAAKSQDFNKAEEFLVSAEEFLLKAHNVQTKMLADEAGGSTVEPNLLLIHAQDHLMNTILLKDLSKTIIDLYKKH